jgi:hypothetical protein
MLVVSSYPQLESLFCGPSAAGDAADQGRARGPQSASCVVNALAHRVIDEHGEDASEEAREVKRDYRNIARGKPRGIDPWAISRAASER